MVAQFVTIGHSNRNLDEFLDMLCGAQVKLLVDVRTFPRSRANPVFNIDQLPINLAKVQIGYRHCSALGGRRPKQLGIDQKINGLWRVQSFHNYSDYAFCDQFGAAFEELLHLGSSQRVALMCAEAVWWRCHRRIITDYLLLNGQAVDHLMTPGKIDRAMQTPGCQKTGEGKVIYPAKQST